MKKTILAMLSLVTIMSVVIYSCQKERSKAQLKTEPLNTGPLDKQEEGKPKFISWEPEGSKIDQTENGFIVTPPTGWRYIGYDKGKKLISFVGTAGKTISCTCNNASGKCKPFHASGPGGTISGCGGECTNCTMTQSMNNPDYPVDIYTGGYYFASARTRVLKNGESAPAVFDALLELKDFKQALSEFNRLAYRGQVVQNPVKGEDGSVTAPKGYSLIGISIMGRGMVVVVPDKYAVKELGYTTTAKASCSCSKGTCVLKDWKVLGTGAVWCDGDCSTCTLTTDSRTEGIDYSISLSSYTF